jgi:hypothetical protein
MTAPVDRAGDKINCLKCGQRMQVPPAERAKTILSPALGVDGENSAPSGGDASGSPTGLKTGSPPPLLNEPGSQANPFLDFVIFKRMAGPWLLIGLYWLLVLIFIGMGGLMVVMGFLGMGQGGGIWSVIFGVVSGLSLMIVGPLVYRVAFEVMITQFRIYETLREIRDKL